MSEAKQIDLTCFLDKVAACYPYGIPRSAIRVPQFTLPRSLSEEASEEKLCAFVVVAGHDGDRSALSEEHDELLRAIAQKGLQLLPEDYSIRLVDSVSLDGNDPEVVRSAYGAQVVIVFGAPSPIVAPVTAQGSAALLATYRLSDIAADPQVKKAFWRRLKEVLSLIGRS